LPKPKETLSTSIIDPSIDIEIIGAEVDNVKLKTRAIISNGFNPIWKEEFQFKVLFPDIAFLRFEVQHLNTLVGSFAIHLPNIEQGFRHIPLFNWKGECLRFSTLFVKIELRQK
jgi:hypothetical protein